MSDEPKRLSPSDDSDDRLIPTVSKRGEARTNAQLLQLKSKIEYEFDLSQQRMRSSLKHAAKAGKHLALAKKLAGHGNWLAWFGEQGFNFSENTAQRYMRVYGRWNEIRAFLDDPANASRVTLFGFRDALALLAKPANQMASAQMSLNGTAPIAIQDSSSAESEPNEAKQQTVTPSLAKAVSTGKPIGESDELARMQAGCQTLSSLLGMLSETKASYPAVWTEQAKRLQVGAELLVKRLQSLTDGPRDE